MPIPAVELARAVRRLAEESTAAKASFVGRMQHELMTPLHAIGGYMTLIEMGLRGPVTAELVADLGRIRQHQQHLMTLVTDVLTFAGAETGTLDYRPARVSVDGLLRDVSEMLQGPAEERALRLVYDLSDPIVAWADAGRTRQILLNLVMNAVKYATEGGVVTLSATMSNGAVMINVADQGPGIPADALESIFAPFVQLVDGLADRQGGVGLGLAISRDLARAMNGDLTVTSRVAVPGALSHGSNGVHQCGSTFTLTLPSEPPTVPPEASSSPVRLS